MLLNLVTLFVGDYIYNVLMHLQSVTYCGRCGCSVCWLCFGILSWDKVVWYGVECSVIDLVCE